jgi:hypothetical protein
MICFTTGASDVRSYASAQSWNADYPNYNIPVTAATTNWSLFGEHSVIAGCGFREGVGQHATGIAASVTVQYPAHHLRMSDTTLSISIRSSCNLVLLT